MLKTPVLFIVFNRPDTTSVVFESIRQVKPSTLYIAADGPRTNHPTDSQNCMATRAIMQQIDWPCNIKTLFQEKNLGCRIGVSTAINWFFSLEEEGIIIEDDIVASPSFFYYCQELLERYRHDDRIMQINGLNHKQRNNLEESYYFSKFGPIWGWATWRRAWEFYDVDMTLWPTVRDTKRYKDFCDTPMEAAWRFLLFNKMYSSKINTWDFQWAFTKLIHSGLSITPKENLIQNIGFSDNSTHTAKTPRYMKGLASKEISFPLTHPQMILRHKKFDKEYVKDVAYGIRLFLKFATLKLRGL